VGGGDRVGPRRVNARMNDEGGRIDRIIAFDDVAAVVAADEVRDLDLAEMHAERIDPERVGKLGVARGDVSGDPLVEAEFREQSEARRQFLLAMQPLFRRAREFWRHWQLRFHRGLIDRLLGLDVHGHFLPGVSQVADSKADRGARQHDLATFQDKPQQRANRPQPSVACCVPRKPVART